MLKNYNICYLTMALKNGAAVEDSFYIKERQFIIQDHGNERGLYCTAIVYLSCMTNLNPESHIEFRFFGAKVCKGLGLASIADLLDFEPNAHVHRQFRLSDINWRKADRKIEEDASFYMRRYGGSRIYRADRKAMVTRQIDRVRRFVGDNYNTPNWADREEFPVQVCMDALPVLRKCAVHLPMNCLIKKHIPLIWP